MAESKIERKNRIERIVKDHNLRKAHTAVSKDDKVKVSEQFEKSVLIEMKTVCKTKNIEFSETDEKRLRELQTNERTRVINGIKKERKDTLNNMLSRKKSKFFQDQKTQDVYVEDTIRKIIKANPEDAVTSILAMVKKALEEYEISVNDDDLLNAIEIEISLVNHKNEPKMGFRKRKFSEGDIAAAELLIKKKYLSTISGTNDYSRLKIEITNKKIR